MIDLRGLVKTLGRNNPKTRHELSPPTMSSCTFRHNYGDRTCTVRPVLTHRMKASDVLYSALAEVVLQVREEVYLRGGRVYASHYYVHE